MVEARHTAGPWDVEDDAIAKVVYITAGEITIAEVIDKNSARVLAAAPEMLGALCEAGIALEALRSGKRDGATMGNASIALDVVTAAIEKARPNA